MFAWSPSDMPGIDPNIICHRLHINRASKLVAQKRRNFAPEQVAIINAEIDKLLAASFIEEVSYSEWPAKLFWWRNKKRANEGSALITPTSTKHALKTTFHCRESTNS
ncbi:hypothetical protein L3X38_003886 [Prunus dulcis]|uniref:Uncharacterized protein n=1 Tax=Prunus dulcis TaxID=3755 RepID=A0AAD4ZMU5_PRUDU|nr:hypothetical protein L3X38_003886 [Prunus dulcis]